jgi:hypothetical protein
MSIISIKKYTPFNIESDSTNTLNYENYHLLYPNDIVKTFLTTAAIGTTVTAIYETFFFTRYASVFRNPINILPICLRFWFNYISSSSSIRFGLFISEKKNKLNDFFKNFLYGFTFGGYANIYNLLLVRRTNYFYDKRVSRVKLYKSAIYRQSQYSFLAGGLSIGTFWGLYYSLRTCITRGEEKEFYLKKVGVGIFSAYLGFLFNTLFYLITVQSDYYVYSETKLDFVSVLLYVKKQNKYEFLNYMLSQKRFSSYIIFNGITFATLDYMNLI